MNEHLAYRVSIVTIVVNAILSIFKLIAGFLSHSKAMISDGIHSLSDVITTFMVMVGIFISCHKPDKSHPYGHDRIECIVSILLAIILCSVGFQIGMNGISEIFTRDYKNVVILGHMAIVAAVVSIVVKEIMYWYTRTVAIQIKSSALMADAWHHRSDALSSIGSFIGVVGAKLGFPILDALASIVISIFIIKAGIDIFIDATKRLVDCACSDELLSMIKTFILSHQEILSIDNMRSRIFASKIYLEVEIGLDFQLTLDESHRIAHMIHDEIESHFSNVKCCMIHVNPVYDIVKC